jgi:streptogramin lyase
MKAKCNGWGSALALLGILTVYNSTNFAGAQEKTSAYATPATFSLTTGLATDSTGDVYVANSHNTILKITRAGVVMTFAGKPDERGTADGVSSGARFVYPIGIAIGAADNVYVADKVSNTIRKITPSGEVTTFAGSAGVSGHADGAGGNASFSGPVAVATDSSGNLYVADYGNSTIRKVSPTGEVTTIAGLAGQSGDVDGTGAAARFTTPYSIATDREGNIFVAEISSHVIRKITPAGVVTTLAGKAGEEGHANGLGNNATFSDPHGVATDSEGNVYVADYGNDTIRKITPAGVVTTLAGQVGQGENGEFDGIGSAATFFQPMAVATDRAGNVFVLEADNIREIAPAGEVSTFVGALFGPWHLQNQFCEWDVPPDSSGAVRSGTRKCALNQGTTYCSSSVEVTSSSPGSGKPKVSLAYDAQNSVNEVDTKFKVEPAKKGTKGDPPGDPGADSWLHYVVTITVSSTSSCK